MAALGVLDVTCARHTKARWFFLHAWANLAISLLCLPDLFFVVYDPLVALASRETIHWPMALVFSVHVYHVAFFKDLNWIDWLHHIIMIAVGAPMLITGEVGPLMNFNNFWMCGVPGGIDYCMLFCVKQGWMEPLTEKRYNSMINVWMRAPFLVCTGTLVYLQMFVQHLEAVPRYVSYTRVFLMLLACWNALFFMERVVGNFHVCEYKAKLAKKEVKRHSQHQKLDTAANASSETLSPPRAGTDRNDFFEEGPYDTDEHVGATLFMAKTISHKDLEELAEMFKEKAQ
eukprot:CAMPEP_0206047602 /NCGR_PEP_ID=MMETSP1466-20131121/21656_1 /ASSEMBLY_ACC=CAM_ASM_001126 /TAXON_ID=44452 /ORGANISM="Pavlova gyrans, Strain CCMP608" /LENGTH=286 /DNA_ID=CAMNT_0053422621 /DNA_START=16 /DNA_END=876 /DNA_ORIENTATION=+